MGLSVQLCPVGSENTRVIAGLGEHLCSVIYLLQSIIDKDSYIDKKHYALHEKLVKLSQSFTDKIKKRLDSSGTFIVEKDDCSFIDYKKCVRDLCKVIKNARLKYGKETNLKEIWINVGTATPLFATAAFFIASFNTNLIRLFYTSARNYTINELLKEESTKESILAIFQENGLTYPGDGNGYDHVVIPVVPAEKLPINAQKILSSLHQRMGKDFTSEFVSQTNILKDCGAPLEEEKTADEKRAIKMGYRHNFIAMMERGLIENSKEGKEQKYRLTEAGIAHAIALDCLYPENTVKQHINTV